jgi:hypothetical protein
MILGWVGSIPPRAGRWGASARRTSASCARHHSRPSIRVRMSSADPTQVHDIDLDLSTSFLPLLAAAGEHADRAVRFAGRVNGAVVAHAAAASAATGSARPDAWTWTLDQAMYDAGVRRLVAPRSPQDLKDLTSRLPDDARYWALVAPAALTKQAKKLAGLYRRSGELVEMVGTVASVETASVLQKAAEKSALARHAVQSTAAMRVVIGGTLDESLAIAKFVVEQCPALQVAAVMMEDADEDGDDLLLVQELAAVVNQDVKLVFSNFARHGLQSRIKRLRTVLKFCPTLYLQVGR